MKCLFIYFLIVFLLCCVSSCNKAQNSNLTDISSKNLAENSVSNNYPTEIDNKTLSEEANVFNSKKSQLNMDKKLLYFAGVGNDLEIQELLKQGANPNALINLKGVGKLTPFIWTLSNSHESSANIFLLNRVNVNQTADFISHKYIEKNVTPLMAAARNGLFSIVKILIEKGARVNDGSSMGNSSLMTGNSNIIMYLLEHKANPNTKNQDGDTALIYLMKHLKMYSEAEISQGVEALLKNGANIEVVNKKGETPMNIAVRYDAKKMIELLKNSTLEKL